MYKRILLPLDGSALAEQALPYAVVQAERFQAELILLKVFASILNVLLLAFEKAVFQCGWSWSRVILTKKSLDSRKQSRWI